jgi:hypothetical protein
MSPGRPVLKVINNNIKSSGSYLILAIARRKER